MAHDVMELWRNPAATGLNFTNESYADLMPLLTPVSEVRAGLRVDVYFGLKCRGMKGWVKGLGRMEK